MPRIDLDHERRKVVIYDDQRRPVDTNESYDMALFLKNLRPAFHSPFLNFFPALFPLPGYQYILKSLLGLSDQP
jgi:hypothetical protein